MARTQTVETGSAPTVAFEVERFGWTTADRIEVAGRWFGLRGHRFMRPSLLVDAGGERRRLLALLEHKPWAAAEGDLWVAAFAWDGDPVDVEAAELAVAPTVAVELPPALAPGAKSRSKARGAARTGPRIAAHTERRDDALRRELAAAQADVAELRAERERAHRAHRAEVDRLRHELAADRDALAQVRAELELLREAADAAGAEPEPERLPDPEPPPGQAERDAAVRERDAALGARDAAVAEREALKAQVDAAVRERDERTSQRDVAAAARGALAEERDEAARERDEARRERDEARRERDEALRERDAALAAAGTPRPAFPPPTETARRRVPRTGPGRTGSAAWAPRLLAVAALLIVVVVLLTLLRGVL
jgi:hypothetical protein